MSWGPGSAGGEGVGKVDAARGSKAGGGEEGRGRGAEAGASPRPADSGLLPQARNSSAATCAATPSPPRAA